MIFPFLLITLALLSLWVRRDPKIWGSLLVLSLVAAFYSNNILLSGIALLGGLAAIWVLYAQKQSLPLFIALIALTLCFKLRLFLGFNPIYITPKFRIGLDMVTVGLFPLALLVPLAQTKKDWQQVFKGVLVGLAGIGILAILATIGRVTHWEFKLPNFMPIRAWSNLFLTSIPEEAFYRGFLQAGLCRYFSNIRWGNGLALLLTSAIFAGAHVYWSPNLAVLTFVFLASLLYGGVYLYSKRIESAILTHFALNLIHMVFFSYHAL